MFLFQPTKQNGLNKYNYSGCLLFNAHMFAYFLFCCPMLAQSGTFHGKSFQKHLHPLKLCGIVKLIMLTPNILSHFGYVASFSRYLVLYISCNACLFLYFALHTLVYQCKRVLAMSATLPSHIFFLPCNCHCLWPFMSLSSRGLWFE